jgi:ABC-type transporter Mla subunit MlaD
MASNTVDLHLNIQNALQENLKQNNEQMSSFNDKMQQAEGVSQKVSQRMQGVGQKLKGATQQMSRFGNVLQRVVPAFGVIFGGGFIVDTVKEAMELNQTMADVAYQMGMGAQGARQLEQATYGVVQATGLATDKAQELVSSIAQLHVGVENIEALATTASRFSEITGVSADSTARLTGELMRTGRMGAEATQQIMAGMASVQRTVGMSASEMQQLTETIQETTKLLNQMNKTAGEIEDFNKGVVQLSGAFASAGVQADKANQFINELLDPSKVEQNAFLYSKLGVSMEEAFSGDVAPEKLIPRFKQLGQEMQNMSGPAAASMAESLGMPLQTLRQMGEIDMEDTQEMMRMMNEEGKSMQEAMAAMQEGQERAGRSFEDAINRLKGSIQPLISKFLIPFINKFADMIENLNVSAVVDKLQSGFQFVMQNVSRITRFLKPSIFIAGAVALLAIIGKIRKKFYTMATGVKEDMQTALVGATEQSAEKSRKIVSSKLTQGFSRANQAINSFWEGSGGGASMTEKTQKAYENIQRQAEATRTLANENQASYKATLANLEAERSTLDTRMEYLESVNMTGREQREYNRLLRRSQEITDDIQKQEKRRQADEIRYQKQRQKQVDRMSEQQLRTYQREQEEIKQSTQLEMQQAQEQQKILQFQQKEMKQRLKQLKSQSQSRGLTTDELEEMQKINKWHQKNEQELNQINEAQKERRNTIAQTEQQIGKITDAWSKHYKAIARDRELATGEGAEEVSIDLRGKIADRITSAYNRFRSGLSRSLFKVSDRVVMAGRTIQDTFSPRNLKRTLGSAMRSGGRGVAAGMKGLGKIMTKLTIPLMLIGAVMSALQPLFKAMQPVMDKLKDALLQVFNQIFKAVAPAFLRIFSALLPMVGMLINTLLPPLIQVLGYLLKFLVGNLVPILGDFIGAMLRGLSKLPFVSDKLAEAGNKVEASTKTIGNEFKKAGANLVETGQNFDKVSFEGVQSGLKDVAGRIEKGTISLGKGGGAAGGATAGGGTVQEEWTPAMLTAGRTGVSVEEHAKRTRKREAEKAEEAQNQTAENTRKTNELLEKQLRQQERIEQLEERNRNLQRGRQGATEAGNITGITPGV